ncbi:MAG: rod shape-determining protein MreC [Candidatus Bathyarchaeia archaeon]
MKFLNFKNIILVTLLVAILSSFVPGVRLFMADKFLYVVSPFGKFLIHSSNKLSAFTHILLTIKDLIKENAELKQKNQELIAVLSEFNEIKRENKILKSQLGFIKEINAKKLIPAYIIGRQPFYSARFVFLNRGKKDGVELNQAVVQNKFLIGRIIEVFDYNSKAELISSSNFEVSALILPSRAQGVVKGQIGGGIILDQIPLEVEIKEGDFVETSGFDGFPKAGFQPSPLDCR